MTKTKQQCKIEFSSQQQNLRYNIEFQLQYTRDYPIEHNQQAYAYVLTKITKFNIADYYY